MAEPHTWRSAPPWPRPTPGVVDVWRADLSVDSEAERALLSPDERTRAGRLVDPANGRRWSHARGILRALLGRYAGLDPRELRFGAGPHGKPTLVDAPVPVRFNLSHAGDLALYAVALDREVGVDVELPRPRVDAVAIAARTFGPAEAERLRRLDPARRDREFLRAWVRWEATLKCHGTGIGGAEGAPSGPDPALHELNPGGSAAAALAVAGPPCEVRCWQWAGSTG